MANKACPKPRPLEVRYSRAAGSMSVGPAGPAGAQGPAGPPGTGIPAPALVATSNITQSGAVVVDGVNTNTLAAGSVVLCTAQTNPAQNGYKVVNNSGAWTDPSYYDSDADVAALLGVASGATLGGTLGAGSVWVQRSGATQAGAKTFVRVPDAADKAVVTCLLPSGDTSGATDANAINAALAAAKAAGGGTVQLANTGVWYVNADLDGAEGTQGVYLIGSGGGATGPTSGTRLIRVGGSAFNTGHRAFTQPAVGATVVVTVDSTAGMVVGKRARTRAVVSSVIGNTYVITAIGSGTVTLRNDGATGNDAPASAIPAEFLRSDEAIVSLRSNFASAVRDLQIQAASPTFCGTAVTFEGATLGSDSSHCDVWDCSIITAAFNALPTLVPLDATTHPAATLTGLCDLCLDFVVEILSPTTYRYSTDGGRTWDESSDTSPITIAATHVFPSTSNAYGLTLNLPVPGTPYVAGYKYRAQQGIQRGIELQNCFDCDTWARIDRVVDGIYSSGVSNTILGTGRHIAGYLVNLLNCNSTNVDVTGGPGGVGYGRGGIWARGGRGNRYTFASGDQLTGGSWVWLTQETAPDLKLTTSQAAGAAISLLNCVNVKIRGWISATRVFDASRAGSVTAGVMVEDVDGYTWDSVSNTLFSGLNVVYISYVCGITKAISNAYLINSARSFAGLVCGTGTQTLVNGCLNVGGKRSGALAWGGSSGGAHEIANSAHGYGEGLVSYPPQNVATAGHSFLVRDSAATNGQRPGFRVSQLGVCHPGSAITLANGANDNIAIKSSYVEISGPTGAFSISGFVADTGYNDGQILRIVWTVAQALTIKHDAVSGAGSRTVTPTAADVVCATPAAGGYGWAEFRYSVAISRWRLLDHT